MNYFAKLLPVPGEIKDGDIALFKGNDTWPDKYAQKIINNDYEALTGGPFMYEGLPHSKIKLFLCSRNIEVGNKIINPDTLLEEILTQEIWDYFHTTDAMWSSQPYFKVIGEISPEAKWVKDGEEFDEYRWIHESGEDMDTMYLTQEQKDNMPIGVSKYLNTVGVKGPCGHFH